jgi:hypothetical protein
MKRINREWVLQNLRETIEHIESVIKEVESGNDGAVCESWMVAIYRDLNRAWNGRFVCTIKEGVKDDTLCCFPADVNVAD